MGRRLPRLCAVLAATLPLAPASSAVAAPGDGVEARKSASPVGDPSLRTPEAVVEALATLAQHHPDRTRLIRYGRSGGGRPLVALELHPPGVVGAGMLAIVPDLARPSSSSDLIELIADRLERWKAQPSTAQDDPLAHARLLVVPVPDPDGLAGEAQPGRCPLQVDFPTDWRFRRGISGPWPMSEPETRKLEQLLRRQSGLVAVALTQAGEQARQRRGGLLEHAKRALELGTYLVAPEDPLELALETACRGLPHLVGEVTRVAPAGRTAIRVELTLRAEGRWSPGPLTLDVEGVRSLAWSMQRTENGEFVPLQGPAAATSLELLPGATLRLRGVVDGAGAGLPAVLLRAPRARELRLPLQLAVPAGPR